MDSEAAAMKGRKISATITENEDGSTDIKMEVLIGETVRGVTELVEIHEYENVEVIGQPWKERAIYCMECWADEVGREPYLGDDPEEFWAEIDITNSRMKERYFGTED